MVNAETVAVVPDLLSKGIAISLFFITITGASLLSGLILLLLIYQTRGFYSQEPVAVSQSSMISGICDT